MIDKKIKIRFITATSLFDGHDASINIIRRFLQREGVEVIHLGHNRSVEDVVRAAIQEDAQAVAISSYQGGHNEYFKYMIDSLKEKGCGHIKIFGGGGGVIVKEEIVALEAYGVCKIYSPEDGQKGGMLAIAKDMVERCCFWPPLNNLQSFQNNTQELIKILNNKDEQAFLTLARLFTLSQRERIKQLTAEQENLLAEILQSKPKSKTPVIGFSGTGGAGKSSFIDEFLAYFQEYYSDKKVALICTDPSQRKTGGALLGDRLRMNSLANDNVFMYSLATRGGHGSVADSIGELLKLTSLAEFDLILLESSGMGQSDTMLVDYCDVTLYLMTSEFGAETQLEKISMLDYADIIILNKFDRERSQDALKAIRKQYRRNHNEFSLRDEELPVYATIASKFNDSGCRFAIEKILQAVEFKIQSKLNSTNNTAMNQAVISTKHKHYLAEISQSIREYKEETEVLMKSASLLLGLTHALKVVGVDASKLAIENLQVINDTDSNDVQKIIDCYNEKVTNLGTQNLKAIASFFETRKEYNSETICYNVRDKLIQIEAKFKSLSGLDIPKVALPESNDWGEIIAFLRKENLPGRFPFTAGVFPLKRKGEDPTRMFAGEGGPERTNRRFHFISSGQGATRLSTAFDSITLYGENPDKRPDIFGKIGNAGVSIASVDDIKKLYSGFDLNDPSTSVSMTINGPAPMILAFFLNAAIDQRVEKYLREEDLYEEVDNAICDYFQKYNLKRPRYQGELPDGNNGLGLLFLGVSSRDFVDRSIYERLHKETLANVRGTVQADILKEDQAQNTCIFSTEFALKMMGDIQEYFIEHNIRNFYSVSISGYHIAEAGANPITQVAFTLANGFTFIEYYLTRGMKIDTFAHNLSFFFSNGMDPEYSVIGRVARRIWAIAMKNKYGASERAQKLKYHIQTSGRSLHAQEISFNDIRTTLQALYAITDNCNSLHTNAYDEAITTPTPQSVRRAIAIQMIINQELGLTKNENPMQGSYFINKLTDMVEDAILEEFERISERGGVLGAMETMYQRNKIQEESMYYEGLKQSGELPIMGVNTFLADDVEESLPELMRSSDEEKENQLKSLALFQENHSSQKKDALDSLKQTASSGENVFAELMQRVQVCSLGEISQALYQVGGRYRRNM